jgi:hypothetical protein
MQPIQQLIFFCFHYSSRTYLEQFLCIKFVLYGMQYSLINLFDPMPFVPNESIRIFRLKAGPTVAQRGYKISIQWLVTQSLNGSLYTKA